MKEQMHKLGCKYLPEREWISLNGLHCISFCNGEFLNNINKIKKYAKSTTFVNCMTWNFPKELEAQENGNIDFHLYQTQHQFEKVSKQLQNFLNYKPLMFNPYFDKTGFPFIEKRNKEDIVIGRISRADTDKYGLMQFWIWNNMTVPKNKKGIVLGWNEKSYNKYNSNPPSYSEVYSEGEISQQEFYSKCDLVVMTTDTYENLPRVGFEAMSSGSLLVVDDKAGWKVLVDDGITGWRCKDHKEFVYKASRAAFEFEETQQMRLNAYNKIDKIWGKENSMKSWENVFKEWEKI
jgi:glycosyltransferase involved in cell wall biosynthesis